MSDHKIIPLEYLTESSFGLWDNAFIDNVFHTIQTPNEWRNGAKAQLNKYIQWRKDVSNGVIVGYTSVTLRETLCSIADLETRYSTLA